MKEQWKSLHGRKGGMKQYYVSNLGRIASANSPEGEKTVLHPVVSNNFAMVTLYGKKLYVHKLVAGAFLDKPSGAKKVIHKDGNTLNNAAGNLEWSWNLLTQEDRKKIIEQCQALRHNKTEIARKFGISRRYLYDILNKKEK